MPLILTEENEGHYAERDETLFTNIEASKSRIVGNGLFHSATGRVLAMDRRAWGLMEWTQGFPRHLEASGGNRDEH